VAGPLVSDFVNGLSSTLIVYGQTGSGKTYTMFGEPLDGSSAVLTGDSRGVVPRVCEEVLEALKVREEQGIDARVAMSYVEVYGQEVFDLLRDGARVGQSRVAGQRYVLDGNCETEFSNLTEVHELLRTGDSQKRRAATAMNFNSTRAHTVVALTLCQRNLENGTEHTSRFLLADLGGSEQLAKSKANEGMKDIGTTSWAEYYQARERVSEATGINLGLFALKNCIDALNERQVALKEGRRPPRVPYQDSKLTMLLSGALGGDARTAVVVAGTLDSVHAPETIQTLRFGERCRGVENKASLNSADLRAAVDEIDLQISMLESDIRRKERWETRREVRQDIEGEETIATSVLVGAEAERAKLESALRRRSVLLGDPQPDDR